ncbi:MAG: SDR family NAD(P)-dependent oxidoreductase [Terriglobia bacterium]|jgi:NAD(P)-dependent dehydrogenase (short-subunit alcohol dehydrogenase family)
MDFQNKVVVVTGGASGIGLACCREFAQRHATVAVVDLDEKAGRRATKELRQSGGRVEFFSFDVSKGAQVEAGVAKIAKKLGGIDILINNAGIQRYGTAVSCSEEDWDLVLGVNLKSAFLMSKYVIPLMIKRGGGAIVNTGSVQSVAAQSNSVHYVVSKHGILGLTRCLALDYAKQNIRANCVMPGAIDTPMLRWAVSLGPDPEAALAACNRIHLRGKMGKPEEVARVMVFLASDLASFITGAAIAVDGGILVPAGGMANQEGGLSGPKS